MIKKILSLFYFASLATTVQADQYCQTENIPATAPSTHYQPLKDGTIYDNNTGLMWRVCLEGLSGKSCDQGEPLLLSWANALLHVPVLNSDNGFAGYKDWRLPNIRELSTLVELQCANPAINLNAFVNAPSEHVWSSSPYHFYTHYSWYVDFENGAATYDERISKKSIRLVRDK